jgi:dTDP-4-dehydrorhamnose reductase
MNQILLLGGSGILGSEVLRHLIVGSFEYVAPTSTDLDIRDKEKLFMFIAKLKPSWIINCAAWTNVDGAESSIKEARELNSLAVGNLGTASGLFGCKVIHISTDYVFDGESSNPYDESSSVNPVNKYGESKLQGEDSLLLASLDSYVIRTSWLYGTSGKNFVKTIVGKAIQNEEVRVVNDQVGSPTSARDLAGAIISIVSNQPEPGIYNYSNEGSCSWFEFAQRIYERVGANPSLVLPISSDSLNLLARRPRFSLLSKEKWKSSGLAMVPRWEDSLDLLLPEIVAELR